MPLTANEHCCEEAAILPPGLDLGYVPCNKPATKIVGWKGRSDPPIRMCDACADHNIRNRGGQLIKPYDTPKMPSVRD